MIKYFSRTKITCPSLGTSHWALELHTSKCLWNKDTQTGFTDSRTVLEHIIIQTPMWWKSALRKLCFDGKKNLMQKFSSHKTINQMLLMTLKGLTVSFQGLTWAEIPLYYHHLLLCFGWLTGLRQFLHTKKVKKCKKIEIFLHINI